MAYKKRSKEDIQKEVATLTDQGMEQIKKFQVSTEDQLELLNFMSRFYKYSAGNQARIQAQYPNAYGTGSFKFFTDQGLSLEGQKSIRILAPSENKYFRDAHGKMRRLSEATPLEKVMIENKELHTVTYRNYRPVSVFDITQTDAKPEDYPKLFPNRSYEFAVDDPKMLRSVKEGLTKLAEGMNIPLTTPNTSRFGPSLLGTAKGAFARAADGTREIVMRTNLTPSEEVSTLIHELTHAKLHDPNRQVEGSFWSTRDVSPTNTNLKELQAELTSYVVSKHYGIDTKEETIPYLADWTKNMSVLDLEAPEEQEKILNQIKDVSKDFIETIDEVIDTGLKREQEREKEQQLEQFTDEFNLTKDRAFSKEKLEKLHELYEAGDLRSVVDQINLTRNEALFDWAYKGTLTSEEVDAYKEEVTLNLQKKIIDGHHFFQVDENMEIFINSSSNENLVDMKVFREIGSPETYTVSDRQAAERLFKAGASPVPKGIMGLLNGFLSQDNEPNIQKQILQNQIMSQTYEEDTGRSM